MYMPAFQAKKLVKGLSDETEGSDLQGTLGRQVSGERFPYAHGHGGGGRRILGRPLADMHECRQGVERTH
jgi:hypothetical protein